MLLTHFIWQTDLKPLSGTNAKNGAIPPSLTPTMYIIHARCNKASEWVGGSLQCKARYLGDLVDVACGCRCWCGEGWGGWWCCGFVFDDGTTLMGRIQVHKYIYVGATVIKRKFKSIICVFPTNFLSI